MNRIPHTQPGARPLATSFTLSGACLSGVSAFRAVSCLPKNRVLCCAYGAFSAFSAVFSVSSAVAYWTSPSEKISDYLPNLGRTFSNATMAATAYISSEFGQALLKGVTSAVQEEVHTATRAAFSNQRNDP